MAKPQPQNTGLHPMVVFLVVACAMGIGYAIYREMNKPSRPQAAPAGSPASPGAAAAGTISEASVGSLSFKIEAPAAVPFNATQQTAKVSAEPGVRFQWSILNGTIVGTADRDTITWNPQGTNEVLISCKAEAPDGRLGSASLRVRLLIVPQITRFEAVPPVVTAGQAATLAWSIQDVEALVLNPGNADVANVQGAGYKVQPTETTTYTLKGDNQTGVSATKDCTVRVVPPPSGLALRAEPVAGSRTAYTLIAEFKDGKAVVQLNNVVIGVSETSPLRIQVDQPASGAVAELVVTNEAGTAAKTTLTFPNR